MNPNNLTKLLAWPLIVVIWAYRYTFSPLIGNSCRFEPTCSRYAEEALRKYGLLKGFLMAVKRIGKCHPWGESGFDPVR